MKARVSKKYPLPLSKNQAALIRRRWRRWLRLIEGEIARQISWREMYDEYWDIVEGNPAVKTPGDFHDWVSRNYMAGAFIGIRRLTDPDNRSLSLRGFLTEIQEFADAMTRGAHRSRYERGNRWLADLSFDNLARDGARTLAARSISRDLRTVEVIDRRFRRFVNKRIAHMGPKSAIRKAPSLKDLDAALMTLEKIVIQYHIVFFAHGLVSVAPTKLYDWWTVFYEPWIPRGHPYRPR